MKQAHYIYQDGDHRWLAIARDPNKPGYVIDTNEYVVADEEAALLLDPGGIEIFPAVFSALSGECDPTRLMGIFASHQDPDIISSLALWLEFKPDLKCYTSWLWSSFLPHFGGASETFVSIPDGGMTIKVGSLDLQAVPAHYLHSSGNFHLYDPKAKILFSGCGRGPAAARQQRPVRGGLFSSHPSCRSLPQALDGLRPGQAGLVRAGFAAGDRHARAPARSHLPGPGCAALH